jgi:hypothetical protein
VAQTLGALIPFDSSRWLGQIGYGKPHVFAVRGGHWKQIPYGLELYRPVHQAIDAITPARKTCFPNTSLALAFATGAAFFATVGDFQEGA